MGLDPEGYGNPDFCWLSIHDSLVWSLAGPSACAVAVRRMGDAWGVWGTWGVEDIWGVWGMWGRGEEMEHRVGM